MSTARSNYHAFLLRLQRDTAAGPWRASLQDPHSRRQLHFATLGDLLAYLEDRTGERWHRPAHPEAKGDASEHRHNAD